MPMTPQVSFVFLVVIKNFVFSHFPYEAEGGRLHDAPFQPEFKRGNCLLCKLPRHRISEGRQNGSCLVISNRELSLRSTLILTSAGLKAVRMRLSVQQRKVIVTFLFREYVNTSLQFSAKPQINLFIQRLIWASYCLIEQRHNTCQFTRFTLEIHSSV